MKQMTREQAVAFADSGAWRDLDDRGRAELQMHQERMCMPFSEFHQSLEKTLGRGVWTHEIALDRAGIIRELMGERAAPTFDEICEMIPAEKRIAVLVG